MGDRTYFAACTKGLEPAVESELSALGAKRVELRRGGVSFHGSLRMGYAANLWLRSAIRVQEELLRTRIEEPHGLYSAVAHLDWDRYITPDQTLKVSASVRDAPEFRHSGYAALTVKDAVVDVVRERHGRRPDVDTKRPDVSLKLVVQRDRMLLYRDLSGPSLHKRGWRPIQVKSPLNEATAAGLLILSGWDKRSTLVDPMCGSGTFPIEAAMMATDQAPGLGRHFAFERWVDFDKGLWRELVDETRGRIKPSLDFRLEGADHHGGALSLAKKGAEAAGVAHLVHFAESDVEAYVPAETPKVVTVNPPYGERLAREGGLDAVWNGLGRFLRAQCGGSTAWVLSGNKALTSHLGLRASLRIPVMNGPIECRWLRYEVRARP